VTVFLVGAGPGDPDLLTVRAAHLLARADVVVVDHLVDPRVLHLVAPAALVVHAGKRAGDGDAAGAQARISALLVEHGAQGATVVRLKGGDPFVFGRGTEELDALRAAGIDVEVVPGLTSALSVPALAGVPVTERGVASSVVIASGHDVDDASRAVLAAPADATVVLLMAVANRGLLARRLLDAGRAPSTPVAIIERGASNAERRIPTTLEQLGDVPVASPAVLVLGAVAARLEAHAPGPGIGAASKPVVVHA
jgi:uroporphyrin-III C-methyltransferase